MVRSEQAGYDITTRTASRKGLDAIEYILFNDNLNHRCTQFGSEPEGWNDRTEQSRKVARCEYANLAALDLIDGAQLLVDAWQGNQGYGEVLKQAGEPGSQFPDVHDAVNDVSDALFYIDTLTKDAKLATPLGLFANDCGLEPCVDNVESLFARHSLENVLNNIRGLRLLFRGGPSQDNVGFDDYLIDVG